SALVWAASEVSAELVARTRSALAPILPPLLVFTVGLVLGVGGPGSNVPVAAGFAGLAAALSAVCRPGRSTAALRGYAAGLPVVACVALVGTLLGPRLPVVHRKPFDLRRYVTPAGQPHTALNPLDQVSAWLATPDLSLFSATAPAAVDWRIATLD